MIHVRLGLVMEWDLYKNVISTFYTFGHSFGLIGGIVRKSGAKM